MGIGKHLADRARRYAALAPEAFDAMLAARRARVERSGGKVTLDLVRDLDDADRAARRDAREVELAARVRALPGKRYGVVLDDPEWQLQDELGLGEGPHRHLLLEPQPARDSAARRARPGAVPRAGLQWDSLLPAPTAAHSTKPERFLEMIEAYFPNVPKIELNRRGAVRPSWDAWGNEAIVTEAA